MARFEKFRPFFDPNRELTITHDGEDSEGRTGADSVLVAQAIRSRLEIERDMQEAFKATFQGHHPGDRLRTHFGIKKPRRRMSDDDED